MDSYRIESAADLAHHLKGLQFPLTRQDMIRHALRQGADPEVLFQLSRLRDREYKNLAEVLKELGTTT